MVMIITCISKSLLVTLFNACTTFTLLILGIKRAIVESIIACAAGRFVRTYAINCGLKNTAVLVTIGPSANR